MNLIDEVLRLDKEATQGPWRADEPSNWHGLSGRVMNAECPVIAQFGFAGWKPRSRGVANMELVALYRTAAPKLARALDRAFKDLELIRNMPPNELNPNARKIAEISTFDIESIINDDSPAKATT